MVLFSYVPQRQLLSFSFCLQTFYCDARKVINFKLNVNITSLEKPKKLRLFTQNKHKYLYFVKIRIRITKSILFLLFHDFLINHEKAEKND